MDTRCRVLMEATRDAVVLLTMNNGRSADLNAAAAAMLGGSRQGLDGKLRKFGLPSKDDEWGLPVHRPIGAGLSVPGGAPSGSWPLVVLGVVLADPVVCGMSQAANDGCDRHVDAGNEPRRRNPSGRIPGIWGPSLVGARSGGAVR